MTVTFHLTHHCNLRCSYCYTGEKLPLAMNRDTIDRAVAFTVEEARRSGTNKLAVTFFGGEPLIERESIFYIIEAYRAFPNLTVNYRMSTNGTLLNADLTERLYRAGVFLSLSVDGHPDVHDRHRKDAGGKPTSVKVAAAARLMLERNPATNVTCVLSPDTGGEIDRSVDYLFGLGFRYITTTLDYSADWSVEDFAELKRGYERLSDWYVRKMKSNERFYLSFFDERIRSRTTPPLTASERCSLGGRSFSIAPNGELYPCISFVKTHSLPEFLIGHVATGFDAACAGYLAETSERAKPECAGCQLASRCMQWCSCVNFMSTGRIDRASPVVCYNEKILIEVVDRAADKLWKARSNPFVHKFYNEDYPIISHFEITA